MELTVVLRENVVESAHDCDAARLIIHAVQVGGDYVQRS